MGKTNTNQPKLTFARRTPRLQEPATPSLTVVPETQLDSDQDDDIRAMMQEMRGSLRAIDTKLDNMAARMDYMSQKLEKHDNRIQTLEHQVFDSEDRQETTSGTVQRMEKALAVVQACNEDLEARSRRNNVRITGVPESTHIQNMERYVEDLLRDLCAEDLTPMFLVERAHRILGPRPNPGATPRPIIARLLNYRDRDTVLRAAREKGDIQYQGNSIALYQDFTQAVQMAR